VCYHRLLGLLEVQSVVVALPGENPTAG